MGHGNSHSLEEVDDVGLFDPHIDRDALGHPLDRKESPYHDVETYLRSARLGRVGMKRQAERWHWIIIISFQYSCANFLRPGGDPANRTPPDLGGPGVRLILAPLSVTAREVCLA